MQNRLLVGPQNVSGDGGNVVARAGRQGDLITSGLHGRYYEQTVRGNVFSGSVAGQVTTVGLATTYTGLCLSNPVSSKVNLSVLKVGYSFIVAFGAGAHIGLMTGYNGTTDVTHTAAVTPRSQLFVGSAAACTGKLDSSATLPTAPTLNLILASGMTGAITTVPFVPAGLADVEGAIVLTPGAYCAVYTSTASGTAAGAFSITWEEVPIL